LATSLSPLSDIERAILKEHFFDLDSVSWESRLTHLIYSTGMHPAVPADPARWNLHIETDILVWNRPKTRELVSVPIDPDIRGWVEEMISFLSSTPRQPQAVKEAVRKFGVEIGLPGLRPRGLRHDYIFRVLAARGIMEARELSGTTTRILMGYARRQLARDALRDPRGLF
jgi:integrase